MCTVAIVILTLKFRCTLVEMLSCYGIKFSRTLQAKLDTHLVLPERGPVITTDYMQQILHHQPIGQTELNPEITLRLKKSVTWKILQEIFNDLQIFLEPLMSHLEFLAYFHLHNCEMFSKHLKSQMAKLAAHSVEPVEESTIQLTLSFVGTTELSTEKLFQVSNVQYVRNNTYIRMCTMTLICICNYVCTIVIDCSSYMYGISCSFNLLHIHLVCHCFTKH